LQNSSVLNIYSRRSSHIYFIQNIKKEEEEEEEEEDTTIQKKRRSI
jgi:hypothetical protein